MSFSENGSHKEMASISYSTTVKEDGVSKPAQDAKTDKILICGLIVTIGLTWMLLLLPIIFYHLPDEVYARKNPVEEPSTAPVDMNNSTECSSAILYPMEGGQCQSALQNTLRSMNCDTGESPLVLRDNEAKAGLLIPALRQSSSAECREAAISLLCTYLFGLCDSSGVSIQPTSGQCRNIRDNLCSAEWQQAMLGGLDLPDCDSFLDEQASCPGSDTGSGNITSSGDLGTAPLNTSAPRLLPCRENFFRPEGSVFCVANCHTWSEFSQSVAISTDVVVALSAIIGMATGIAVIVISVLRFKKIFVFPAIFIVYMTCDVLVISFFIIVTYFDRPSLYCSSESLPTSLAEPTPYCVITGMVFTYIVLQLAVWWLFHTSALLWKIGFPLHARSFEKTGKAKYIHLACVIIGVLIPLVPVIALMANYGREVESSADFATGGLGFVMGRFPPILCSGSSSTVMYYSDVLPINLIFFAGITELILLFAVVHKQHGLFVEKKSITSHFKIGTPERKILIALCFYVLLLIFAIPALTLATRVSGLFGEQLINYFTCEARGVDPNNPGLCDEFIDDFRAFSNPELTATAFILIGLFPIVFLIYTLNFEELKEKWMSCQGKRKRVDSSSHNEMHSTRGAALHHSVGN